MRLRYLLLLMEAAGGDCVLGPDLTMTRHQSADSAAAAIPITDDCESVARYNGCYFYKPPSRLLIDGGWKYESPAGFWSMRISPKLPREGSFYGWWVAESPYWYYFPPGSTICDYPEQYIEFFPPDGNTNTFKAKTLVRQPATQDTREARQRLQYWDLDTNQWVFYQDSNGNEIFENGFDKWVTTIPYSAETHDAHYAEKYAYWDTVIRIDFEFPFVTDKIRIWSVPYDDGQLDHMCRWSIRIELEVEWITGDTGAGDTEQLNASELSPMSNPASCIQEATEKGYARAMLYDGTRCFGLDFDTVMKDKFVRDPTTTCDKTCSGEECGGIEGGTVYDLAGSQFKNTGCYANSDADLEVDLLAAGTSFESSKQCVELGKDYLRVAVGQDRCRATNNLEYEQVQASDCNDFLCGKNKVPCGSTVSNIVYEKNALKSFMNNDWQQQLSGKPLQNTPVEYFETIDSQRYLKLKNLGNSEEKLLVYGYDTSDPAATTLVSSMVTLTTIDQPEIHATRRPGFLPVVNVQEPISSTEVEKFTLSGLKSDFWDIDTPDDINIHIVVKDSDNEPSKSQVYLNLDGLNKIMMTPDTPQVKVYTVYLMRSSTLIDSFKIDTLFSNCNPDISYYDQIDYFWEVPEKKIETINLLDLIISENSEECPGLEDYLQIVGADSLSPELSFSGHLINLNRRKGFTYDLKINYKITIHGNEQQFGLPYKAKICGAEKVKFNRKYRGKEEAYVFHHDLMYTETKIVTIPFGEHFYSTDPMCPISSYKIVSNKDTFDPLPKLKARAVELENYPDLMIQNVHIDIPKTLPGYYSAYLIAMTTGGSYNFIKFIFEITRSINNAPYFVEDPIDMHIHVLQENQILNQTKVHTLLSPKILDKEGDYIFLSVNGHEDLSFITLQQKSDSFKIEVDEALVTEASVGNHTIKISLDDDGATPKFQNDYEFTIQIEYTPMNPEELQELQDNQEFMQEAGAAFQEKPGETQVEKKKRLKKLREQAQKIGFTFPDISQEQIDKFNPDLEAEEPKIEPEKVDALGNLKIKINQDLFFPTVKEGFDYSKVLSLSYISASNGKTFQAKSSRRLLLDCTIMNFNSMTQHEKNLYYFNLGYEEADWLRGCSVEIMKFHKKTEPIEVSKGADQVEEEPPVFHWDVTSHDASEIGIKLKFADPNSVSNTKDGKDMIKMEFLEVSMFKSQTSGESFNMESFSEFNGDNPVLTFMLPPIVENEEVVEQLNDSTDTMGAVTDYLSTSNFIVSLLIGGSMQELYGMIRAMQLIILMNLMDIPFPAHTMVFFQGAILFANMDVLSGEDFYEKHFTFVETDPLNERFDDFGIGDKNLVSNSGSYFIAQLIIIVWQWIHLSVFWVTKKYAHIRIVRRVGMYLGKPVMNEIRNATLRLFLESYLDIAMAAILNFMAFFERPGEFGTFFATPTDAMSSILTIIIVIGVLVFPWYILYEARNNAEFNSRYEWMLEGLRIETDYHSRYYFYFMLRRLYIAIILTVFSSYTVIQILSLIALSLANLTYLVRNLPFVKQQENVVEIINEVCTITSAIIALVLLDPAETSSERMFKGWALILIFGGNIAFNLTIVARKMSSNLITSIKETIEQIQNYFRKQQIYDDPLITPEEKEKRAKERKQLDFCEGWSHHRKWLIQNEIEFDHFEEEKEYQAIAHELNIRERAETIQAILAYQTQLENIKKEKVRARMAKLIKQRTQKKRKPRAFTKRVTQIELPVIQEESIQSEKSKDIQILERQGILAGMNKLDIIEPVKTDLDTFEQDLKLRDFTFIFDDLEETQQEFQQKAAQRLDQGLKNRFKDKREKGIIMIKSRMNKGMIASIIQCLLSVKEFVDQILLEEQDTQLGKYLQTVLVQVFQIQDEKFRYSLIDLDLIEEITRKQFVPENFIEEIARIYNPVCPTYKQFLAMDELQKHVELKTWLFTGLYTVETKVGDKVNKRLEAKTVLRKNYFEEKPFKVVCEFCKRMKEKTLVEAPSIELVCKCSKGFEKASPYPIKKQNFIIREGALHPKKENLAMLCKRYGFFYAVVKRSTKWYVFDPEKEQPFRVTQKELEEYEKDSILAFMKNEKRQGNEQLSSSSSESSESSEDSSNSY